MEKVLVTELMWEDGIERLRSLGYEVYYDPDLSRKRKELLQLIPDYKLIIVRNETKVDTEFLQTAKQLRVLGRLGVGVDNIDLVGARKRNVPVIVARNANATSVAEYVMAAMLDASRLLPEANVDVRKGNWNRKVFTGYELNGRTLGLIGLGEIAHRVARRAKAFGMEVIGYDPFVRPYDNILQELGVEQVTELDMLYKRADFISVHVPLTETTQYMLCEEAFQKMKMNAFIINSARGGIIHEVDLVEAVESGEIAGAYIDVVEKEPIRDDSPLLRCDKIKLSPHIAGLTIEAQSRTALLIAEEVHKVYHGGRSLCVVN